jgi:hypothetical protein
MVLVQRDHEIHTLAANRGTFFANHFGDRTLISPVMFADATGDDIVINAADVSLRSAPSIDTSCVSIHGPNVGWVVRSDTSLGVRLSHNHLQNRPGARKSSSRDPPRHLRLQSTSRRPVGFLWCAPTERPAPVRNHSPARVRRGNAEFVFLRN